MSILEYFPSFKNSLQPLQDEDSEEMAHQGRLLREGTKRPLQMSLEHYLEGLREGELSDPGEFTIAAERAKALMAGHALSDPWAAWLCMAQGMVAAGAGMMQIAVTRSTVIWQTDLRQALVELLRQDRFLLAWLNLGWFGSPHWSQADGTLTVEWRGNAWRRYRLASAMVSQLQGALRFSPVPVGVDGRSIVQSRLPADGPLCLYPLSERQPGGFDFSDQSSQGKFERRSFSLENLGSPWQGPVGTRLAAFACKSKAHWSRVTWVHHGVIISQERNTLERPGVDLVACVGALGLTTDLAGFAVVNNDAYFRFVNALKRDVLWML